MDLQPVVLSGGAGTRLWPLSREYYPKQILRPTAERSLLQATLERLEGLSGEGVQADPRPLLVCNEEHRFLVAEQVRELGLAPRRLILEPVGRNTAPALTLAALAAREGGRDPVLLVLPADHVVRDAPAFREAARRAARAAAAGALVTFGVVPTAPETGYGYLRLGEAAGEGLHRVAAFVEKPDAATARAYLEQGGHLWNSGMFVMRASVWLEALGRCRPDILEACRRAHAGGAEDLDFFRVEAEAFGACPADSVDYAVMERLAGPGGEPPVLVVPLEAGWTDVGSWAALWEAFRDEGDPQGNLAQGDVRLHDCRRTLCIARDRLVVGVGLEDLVVVETADAVLVMPRRRAQEVKQVVEGLRLDDRPERLFHRTVYRPWGHYENLDDGRADEGNAFLVKRIRVEPGAALSLQRHRHRAEHWVVLRGRARVTLGPDRGALEVLELGPNESVDIPRGYVHRLENPGEEPLEIVEVQTGPIIDEGDIERLQDVYGRAAGAGAGSEGGPGRAGAG
ncbi:MAG: mannose-1-phosphate guanylyltransferase/mannose-6-phosphate isomerase [Gammaproteobacteria bacterium]|nr:MAG: mannose-1-phosphate guanylyltransferase/mannose-6-phosphate isomerase [Gammaproteobacteria bacterium]